MLSPVSRPSWFEPCVPSPHPPATLQHSQQPLRDGSFLGPSLCGRKQLAIGHKNLYFQKSSKRSLCSGHDVLGFFFPLLESYLSGCQLTKSNQGLWECDELANLYLNSVVERKPEKPVNKGGRLTRATLDRVSFNPRLDAQQGLAEGPASPPYLSHNTHLSSKQSNKYLKNVGLERAKLLTYSRSYVSFRPCVCYKLHITYCLSFLYFCSVHGKHWRTR